MKDLAVGDYVEILVSDFFFGNDPEETRRLRRGTRGVVVHIDIEDGYENGLTVRWTQARSDGDEQDGEFETPYMWPPWIGLVNPLLALAETAE